MKAFKSVICILLSVLCLSLCCCTAENKSLTADYSRSGAVPVYDFFAEESVTPENYQEFTSAYMDFAANLLKNSSSDENRPARGCERSLIYVRQNPDTTVKNTINPHAVRTETVESATDR